MYGIFNPSASHRQSGIRLARGPISGTFSRNSDAVVRSANSFGYRGIRSSKRPENKVVNVVLLCFYAVYPQCMPWNACNRSLGFYRCFYLL